VITLPIPPPGALYKQTATPELAAKLQRRKEEEARAAREAQEAAKQLEEERGAAQPAWQNAATPFGSELAAALQRR